MTDIALLRHGPTDWSADKRLQGRADRPLSPAGRAEVARWRLPEPFAGWPVLASPLARARDTAALLAGGGPVATDARLMEMDFGAWEGYRLTELRERYGDDMTANEARGWHMRPPGGESPAMLWARLAPLLGALARAGGPRLIVAHKAVLRVVLARATGWDMTGKAPVSPRDGCLQHVRLDARGAPDLVRANVPLDGGGPA